MYSLQYQENVILAKQMMIYAEKAVINRTKPEGVSTSRKQAQTGNFWHYQVKILNLKAYLITVTENYRGALV